MIEREGGIIKAGIQIKDCEAMGTRVTWEREGRMCGIGKKKKSWKLKRYLFFLRGFGLRPGSDIARTSPSRGEKFSLWVGTSEMRLGLVPHFAQGPIADVSNPTTSGGDSLIIRMNDMDGWFDIRGFEIRNVGVTAPSCRMPGSATVTARTAKRDQTVSNPMGKCLGMGRVHSRFRVFQNGIDAIIGQDTVSTPSTFLADLAVCRLTGGRAHVAEPTPTEL